VTNPLKIFVKIITYIHMVMYTWWCWHIYKREVVGVELDQLGEEKEEIRVDWTLVAERPDSTLASSVASPIWPGRTGP
jgi:hypothetical protein